MKSNEGMFTNIFHKGIKKDSFSIILHWKKQHAWYHWVQVIAELSGHFSECKTHFRVQFRKLKMSFELNPFQE